MRNILKKMLVILMIAALMLPLYACGQKSEISGEQALEVCIWDAGYGTEWLSANLENFAQLDWVKEKYPDFQYKLISNDQQNYSESRITAGEANTIDLFFAAGLEGTFESYCLDLSEELYNAEVPGEGVLYKDKVRPYMLDAMEMKDNYGARTGKFYSAVVSAGLCSYVYNKTLFDALGLTVPRTTQELAELCQTVKDMGGTNPNYPYTTSIISSKVAYSNRLYNIWWSQYDSLQGYQNYWNAIAPDGTRNSVDIFEEKGRLEATKVYESLYKEELGYYDRTSFNYEFIQGQTRMLTGEGLMMACGEWFSTEMRDLAIEYESRGYDYEIRMMKLPIISSIIDKTPTIPDDETLRKVIDDIDAGLTAPSDSSVSAEDFAVVRAARGLFSTDDSISSHAVVAANSDAKDVAVDFLLYMATDEAQTIQSEKTYGGISAFQFTLEKNAPEAHNKMQTEYGKTYAVLYDVAAMIDTDYAQGVYKYSPLATYGSFTAYLSKYSSLESVFMSDNDITAEQIVQEHDSYWLEDNAKAFQTALARAGLA